MHLDQIVSHIDRAFGEELPFSDQSLQDSDREVLGRIFGDRGYQRYLQDQVNRQIIRDYLANAVVLGHLPEQALDGLAQYIASREGRSALALHMLMSSVEQAAELAAHDSGDVLKPLTSESESSPYIRLVHS